MGTRTLLLLLPRYILYTLMYSIRLGYLLNRVQTKEGIQSGIDRGNKGIFEALEIFTSLITPEVMHSNLTIVLMRPSVMVHVV